MKRIVSMRHMDEAQRRQWTASNRTNWDARAQAHLQDGGDGYDLPALRAGASTLGWLEQELLGPVAEQRLLHLMCHLGTESVSWARAGAEVTAIDLSPASIAAARELAADCGVSLNYHVADVYALPTACDGPYDIIAMTYGVLCWLADLPRLLAMVASRLAPGGRFLLIDGHPFVDQVEIGSEGAFLLPRGYFHDPAPQRCHDSTSYTGSAPLAQAENFQWSHHLGEIVQAVIDAGLQLRALREERFGMYRRYPGMTRRADGYWDPPPGFPELPMLLALLARKPSS